MRSNDIKAGTHAAVIELVSRLIPGIFGCCWVNSPPELVQEKDLAFLAAEVPQCSGLVKSEGSLADEGSTHVSFEEVEGNPACPRLDQHLYPPIVEAHQTCFYRI